MDQLNVTAWVGRMERLVGGISELQAQQISATLDQGYNMPLRNGDPLPPLWHWCAFPPTAPMDELGRDGHPRTGEFLPPLRLERRMWAGGSLQFYAPLRVGERITRQSTVSRVQKKGDDMVFVTVDHVIRGEQGVAIEETQDIAYLPIPQDYAPPRKRPLPNAPVLREAYHMNETMLFRYSAVTFNAHRIHYDADYARTVERYPGLVVHGPLQATLLMQAATRHRGSVPCGFHFRGVHPLFAGKRMEVVATDDADGSMQLYTGQDGHQGMQATAIWQGTV
ncbi:FAS1-like dehydratase domain-containing protein [Phaeobacter marinintestinus]|uniref:FAS1-like dehydratase domain-containing protein n=1 Tax=Falsiphaeobacter marinintestinus TaxID=1492905 RepID=UPI001FECD588|nr:MaoC family dehydratase N-terminal domain-containing protein [Phaeobacter marinintestinus]